MDKDWRLRNGAKISFASNDGDHWRGVYYDECVAFTEAHQRLLEKRLMESKIRMYKVTYKLGFYKGERYVHAASADSAVDQVRRWCREKLNMFDSAESYVAEPPV